MSTTLTTPDPTVETTRHRRTSRLLHRLAAGAAAVAILIGGLAVASPANATTNLACDHGGGSTLIELLFPMQTTPGIVMDLYLQTWNGSSWVYVRDARGNALLLRHYSTTDGWWMTPDGHYHNWNGWNLSPNSGYYRIMVHMYATGHDAGYVPLSNYSDNLRGTTSWCQA